MEGDSIIPEKMKKTQLFEYEVMNMENLIAAVQSVLSITPARWQSIAENISVELLTRQPKPGEWSALECLEHIIDTEKVVFPVRLQAFLSGQDFPGYDPNSLENKGRKTNDPGALAEEFTSLRKSNLKIIARVKPSDLLRTAKHGTLGEVTLAEMLHNWAGHDLMHIVQAERAVLQPFIQGCGPWRRYFADHDIEIHK
jgi:hypothetical protein